MFNVESEAEIKLISEVADSIGKVPSIVLRVNPKTHRFISTGKKESKFGMDIHRAERVAEAITKKISSIRMIGMHMHIGHRLHRPSLMPVLLLKELN